MKVVIIGGVAGGATAAARLRRLSESAEIIIIERSGFISYANCGLPYYIGGVIEDKKNLTLQTPESFWKRFRIEARVNSEALSIDRKNRSVHIRNLKTGECYHESYDYLILSPGAEAVVPKIPGVESDKVFTLRHTEDAFALKDVSDKFRDGRAIVVGGGFIGLECAENLAHKGLAVTLIERAGHVMNPFDQDMAAFLHDEMRKNGIDLRLGTSLIEFQENGKGITAITDKGDVSADFAVLAIGVRPDSKLAREAGLETDKRGSIIVNSAMQTSDEHIYAAGDAVSILSRATGAKAMIALAGPANKEGRIAADNIAGINSTYKGGTGVSVLKLFSLTAASAGMTEETAMAMGKDYDTVFTYQGDHASYYPGSESMMIKLIYEKDSGRILGAQIAGKSGVDKRIDTVSIAIAAGLGVEDLVSLDMAYAPPYSSAKDPMNIAGYIAENKMQGLLDEFSYRDIPAIDKNKSMLIDLRTEQEVGSGMIEGAKNIPLDELRDRTSELDKDKTIYVYCRSGQRSYIGARILTGLGFKARSLSGGYLLYSQIQKDKA